MRRWLPLLIAVQFLTRLPVSLPRLPEPQENGRSLLWYPAVGLLIGALLAALPWLLSDTSALLQAAVLLTVWVWLSGALHLDGLADTADAWVGGHGDRERTLAIMKDPACGPMGVIALILTLLLKFAALTSLVSSSSAWLTLLLVPWIGRLLLPVLLTSTPYARPGGLGQVLVDNAPPSLPWWLTVHALTISTIALVVWGTLALLPLLAVMVFTLYWRRVLIRRLGGTTGDTAGALLEMAETLLLLGYALLG
ncbi:MAG: adenosylcobinamide-GDP ribazoletransferase [Gammaproteobacteria bacterium HGW-Gammaproteobacteria-6]|nr:MAG: adenosylcobinamide-GDP ribazoletransferase [Gammaproteobacteria bacterium HGW-Gammaproteobacteria-6]